MELNQQESRMKRFIFRCRKIPSDMALPQARTPDAWTRLAAAAFAATLAVSVAALAAAPAQAQKNRGGGGKALSAATASTGGTRVVRDHRIRPQWGGATGGGVRVWSVCRWPGDTNCCRTAGGRRCR
jgi:hypothetical protein